jgi:hypothetical protein
LSQGLALAKSAEFRSIYQFVLRAYANGFADGHLSVQFPPENDWLQPAFLARSDERGLTGAVVSEAAAEMSVGATLVARDGQDVTTLLRERVQPLTDSSRSSNDVVSRKRGSNATSCSGEMPSRRKTKPAHSS